MTSCQHLATKAELDGKADKKVEVEVARALGIGLIAKELAGDNLNWISGKGANSLSNIASLKARTAALDTKAAKAGLDAALAGRQANKALSVGNSALGKAGAALGGLASVVGIIGTMATAAALAQLTKRVIEHRKDFLSFRVNNNKIISELNFKASSALNIANNNTLELEKQARQIAENRSKANQALGIAKKNETAIKQIEQSQQVFLQRLQDIQSQVGQAVQTNNNNIANSPVVNDLIQQNRNISNQVNDLATLRNDVIRVENLYRNIQPQVTPSVTPQTGANTQAISRLLTGVELLKARQTVVENKIQDITSQQNQLQNPPTFQSIDTAIQKKIDEQVPPLIEQKLTETNKVNEQKLDNINKNLLLMLPALALIPPIWNKVKTFTPSPCQAPILVPPVSRKVSLNIGLTNKLQAITIAQSALIQKSVNATRNAVNATRNIVQTVNNTLNQTKGFIEKAWSFTRLGKVLDLVQTYLLLHNAAMLSRNLGSSIGNGLSAVINNTINLVKKEDGSNIDINQALGNNLESFLSNLLGAETYQDLNENFKRSSRILNAAANIINTIQLALAGLAEGLELLGNYTGKIGNALKRAGAVFENSYQWMSENFRVRTGRLGRIQGIIDNLQQTEEVVSDLENVTSEFLEVTENVSQMRKEVNTIRNEVTKQEEESTEKATESKSASQGAQPESPDYTPDPQ